MFVFLCLFSRVPWQEITFLFRSQEPRGFRKNANKVKMHSLQAMFWLQRARNHKDVSLATEINYSCFFLHLVSVPPQTKCLRVLEKQLRWYSFCVLGMAAVYPVVIRLCWLWLWLHLQMSMFLLNSSLPEDQPPSSPLLCSIDPGACPVPPSLSPVKDERELCGPSELTAACQRSDSTKGVTAGWGNCVRV